MRPVLARLLILSMSALPLVAAGEPAVAPGLKTIERLGEFAVTCGWVTVVVGMDYVQRHAFAFAPLAAGLGFALLVANLLYINQFPDAKADARAGKRTLVVRLGPARARWGYVLLVLLAALWILVNVVAGALPGVAAVSLLSLLPSAAAARTLWAHAARPALLRPAIKLTILAAVTHGLLLAAALMFA